MCPAIFFDRFAKTPLFGIDIAESAMQALRQLLLIAVYQQIVDLVDDLIKRSIVLDQIFILLYRKIGDSDLPTDAGERNSQDVVLRIGFQLV